MSTITIVLICIIGATSLITIFAPEAKLKRPTRSSTTITIVVSTFLAGLIIYALWNEILVGLFGLPVIGYWQAVGLHVLRGTLLPLQSSTSLRELREHVLAKWAIKGE
jgi:amino acid transporter